MYRSFFSNDLLSELARMQQGLRQSFGISPSIRGFTQSYPAMNVGVTPKSIEIYTFVPGLSPENIEVNIERGVLTISAERKSVLPESSGENKSTVHISERFSGRFRRVVTLPEDADADSVEASYREGVLHITIKRKEVTQARRISIK